MAVIKASEKSLCFSRYCSIELCRRNYAAWKSSKIATYKRPWRVIMDSTANDGKWSHRQQENIFRNYITHCTY